MELKLDQLAMMIGRLELELLSAQSVIERLRAEIEALNGALEALNGARSGHA